jgi:hypothetical protein
MEEMIKLTGLWKNKDKKGGINDNISGKGKRKMVSF